MGAYRSLPNVEVSVRTFATVSVVTFCILAMACKSSSTPTTPATPTAGAAPGQYPQQGAYPQQPGYPQQGAAPQGYPPGTAAPTGQYPQQPGYAAPTGAPGVVAQPGAPGAPAAAPMATPGPLALPCQNDQSCGLAHCNTQYGKCAFPCQSAADCIQGASCNTMTGFCLPGGG